MKIYYFNSVKTSFKKKSIKTIFYLCTYILRNNFQREFILFLKKERELIYRYKFDSLILDANSTFKTTRIRVTCKL